MDLAKGCDIALGIVEGQKWNRPQAPYGKGGSMTLADLQAYQPAIRAPIEGKYRGREIKDYEPAIAVTDNSDGYTFFKTISEKASTKLKENGKLFFEVAQGQSEEVKDIMQKNNFRNIGVIKDYQSIDRVIFGERK